MKRLFVLFCVFAMSSLFAASASSVKSDFFDVAVKESISSKKPLLLIFSGTSWCGWCVKLDKSVLSTSKFKAFAKKNLEYIKIDSDRDGAFTIYKNGDKMQIDAADKDAVAKKVAELKSSMSVRGVPSVFIFKDDKREVPEKIERAATMRPAQFIKALDVKPAK